MLVLIITCPVQTGEPDVDFPAFTFPSEHTEGPKKKGVCLLSMFVGLWDTQ